MRVRSPLNDGMMQFTAPTSFSRAQSRASVRLYAAMTDSDAPRRRLTLVVELDRQLRGQALREALLERELGDDEILQARSYRLEQREHRGTRARIPVPHERVERDSFASEFDAGCLGRDHVAGFLGDLVDDVADDQIATLNHGDIDLALFRQGGADGNDGHARRQPIAIKNRCLVTRPGCREDEIGAAYGVLR